MLKIQLGKQYLKNMSGEGQLREKTSLVQFNLCTLAMCLCFFLLYTVWVRFLGLKLNYLLWL